MALPKRRHSTTRRDKSRTHQKLAIRQTSTCLQCGQQILPHRVCPRCGYYRGRAVVTIKAKESPAK